jgi:apolipoprotein N-acyltransferase
LIRAVDNSIRSSPQPDLVLLPEGVAGLREPRVGWHWSELAKTAKTQGITIAVGASVIAHRDETGEPVHFINTLELMGSHAGELRAQASVPIGSWRPWARSGHYPERWWTKPDQVMAKNEAVGAVLCWEELMVWPWLSHWAEGSQVLLVASNTWFDPSGRIDFAQRRATFAMAKLLDFTFARAANNAVDFASIDGKRQN